MKPDTERVQALADISCLALCCHSNETRASIANLPNSAQLGGTPYHPTIYIRVHAVVWECSNGQRDRQTHVTNIHFASSTTNTKCNKFKLKITNAETNCSFSDAELSQQYVVSRWFLVTHARNAPFLSSNSHHATEESF